jgi:hypothetical protein
MGLPCNSDAYGRALQSQSEFRYVSNTKLSETEQHLTELYDCNGKDSQEEN